MGEWGDNAGEDNGENRVKTREHLYIPLSRLRGEGCGNRSTSASGSLDLAKKKINLIFIQGQNISNFATGS